MEKEFRIFPSPTNSLRIRGELRICDIITKGTIPQIWHHKGQYIGGELRVFPSPTDIPPNVTSYIMEGDLEIFSSPKNYDVITEGRGLTRVLEDFKIGGGGLGKVWSFLLFKFQFIVGIYD